MNRIKITTPQIDAQPTTETGGQAPNLASSSSTQAALETFGALVAGLLLGAALLKVSKRRSAREGEPLAQRMDRVSSDAMKWALGGLATATVLPTAGLFIVTTAVAMGIGASRLKRSHDTPAAS